MKTARLVHFYLGVFFAPLIIFFAFSGTLQVFKLHESCREKQECLADWVAWFGQFHKEQAWIPPKPKTAKATTTPPPQSEPMKWFVALMGVSLIATALLGIYMALNYPSRRKGSLIALGAGIAIPLLLMVAAPAKAADIPKYVEGDFLMQSRAA